MPRGGKRAGAGRKPGPVKLLRRNAVRVMLTDAELRALEKRAAKLDVPISTAAYQILSRTLKRRR